MNLGRIWSFLVVVLIPYVGTDAGEHDISECDCQTGEIN